MNTRYSLVRLGCTLLAVLVGLVLSAGIAKAGGACPDEAAGCLLVNSPLDANVRDSVLTLREAVALANGELDWATLTAAERGQVILGAPPQQTEDGRVYVLFDAQVFSAPNTLVQLDGTGLYLMAGEEAQIPERLPARGRAQVAGSRMPAMPVPFTPPVIGRGPGPGIVLGGGIDPATGEPANVRVIIDGALLPVGGPCIQVDRAGSWLRGLTMRSCPVGIAIRQNVASSTLVGSNGDGINDQAEEVYFESVGQNIIFN